MLKLDRNIGETIMIGDDIRITVADIYMSNVPGKAGKQVKLVIDAPRSVPVHRSEIYLKLKKEGTTFVTKGH